MIAYIRQAQRTIHIAAFEFDLTPVAQALIAAKQRGVDVRWVTDNENGIEADSEPGRGQFAMLQKAGIEIHADDRAALMHNKFWIFDGQIVWTGSTNITESGIFKQDNNTIVLHTPELAVIYEREFQEMWDGKFGPKSPSQLADQSAVVNGTSFYVIFTSEDHAIEEAIIPLVKSAAQSIRFLAFSFTDYPLANAMIQRAKAGVDVAGVYEKVGSDAEGAELKTFFCAQVPVRQDGQRTSHLGRFLLLIPVEDIADDSCQFLPPPEKFEAGLQDYAGIIGLGAAVKYLEGVGFETIEKQELLLNEAITAQIKDIPKLKRKGVDRVFTPGTTLKEIVDYVRENVQPRA